MAILTNRTKKIPVLALVLLLLCAGAVLVFPDAETAETDIYHPQILNIHSYHPGYVWTQRIISGMLGTVRQKIPNAITYHEFLDSKRINPEIIEKEFNALIQQKYRHQQPDIVVVTDEDAYLWYYRYGKGFFPNTPMVFAGVDTLLPEFSRTEYPHTGVQEIVDLSGTIDIMKNIHPKQDALLIIGQSRPALQVFQQQIQQALDKYSWAAKPIYVIDPSATELKEALNQYPGAPILYLGLFKLLDGPDLSLKESVALLQEAGPRHIYTAWEDALGTGVLGGYMLAGKQQGILAGQLILEILLNNTNPSEIPIVDKDLLMPYADCQVARDLNVPSSKFPADTILINQPDSFAAYRNYLIAALIIIAILLSMLLVLVFNIRRRQKAEKHNRALLMAVEYAGHAICIADAEGVIRYINPAFTKLTGYTREEATGQRTNLLKSGMMGEEHYSRLWQTISSGVTWREEIINRKKNGDIYTAEQTISPLLNR
ncbi:MAG: PAS domain S-box protein, partial [Spirochaetaceae bacterium]